MASEQEYIGTALMYEDGTIELKLIASTPAGGIGDALLVYPREHKDYETILAHIGSIKPGEEKNVRPFS